MPTKPMATPQSHSKLKANRLLTQDDRHYQYDKYGNVIRELRGKRQHRKIKLFREDSFIEALKTEGLNEKVDFINEHPEFSELKKYTIPNIQLDVIDCKKGREFVETQLNDWDKLFKFSLVIQTVNIA
jgi:hypothetical protein